MISQLVAASAVSGALASDGPAPASPTAPTTIEPDGTLDIPFNAKFSGGRVDTSARQPDGKILIGGNFTEVHGVSRLGVARLNADGTLDSSFTPPAGMHFNAKQVVLQPNGKVVVIGPFGASLNLARLNADGSLDSAFDWDGKFSRNGLIDNTGHAQSRGTVKWAVVQTDGKIVVVGEFTHVITSATTAVARSCVARFNSDGTFDESYYASGSGVSYSGDSAPTSVDFAARQNNGPNAGKIIIAGNFDRFDSGGPNQQADIPNFVRLNTDGSFDPTFDPNPGYPSGQGFPDNSVYIRGLFIQSDDRIVIFGSASHPYWGIISRFESSGPRDSTFASPAFDDYGVVPQILAVAQQTNGKLIVGGSFHSVDGAVANNVARLGLDGARDNTIAAEAAGPNALSVNSLLVRPADNKILIGGNFSTYGGASRNNLAWTNADGSVDGLLAGLSGVRYLNPTIYAVAVQTDGKILVGGVFSALNGLPQYNLVRLNPDSTVDSSFGPNLGTHGSVRAIRVQPDGKIVIAGNFIAINGAVVGRIARLNSDGTIDQSFDTGTGANGILHALALDAAGNIYAGGSFSHFNDLYVPRLVKLGPNGALNGSFYFYGNSSSDVVYAITAPDATGRLVVGGQFRLSGQTRNLARLSATDGFPESQFTINSQINSGLIFAIAETPSGKYYVGGRGGVARFNNDGTRDTTFSQPFPSDFYFRRALALQNGKLWVGGQKSTQFPALTRLTDTGAVDPSFDSGTGFEITPFTNVSNRSDIYALAVQPDGKLLVGGSFDTYNGTARGGLVRITGPDLANPTPSVLGNVSTRLRAGTGDNALFGGFIVSGTQPKKVIVRALGPSLGALGISGPLENPALELHGPEGLIDSNDDWTTSPNKQAIIDSTVPPGNDLESAIVAELEAGNKGYTAIVRGANGGTGIGVVEVYDLETGTASSMMANISTRGVVQTGENVLIAGMFVVGPNPRKVMVRAIGPSLTVDGKLADPTLELRDSNGGLVEANDNWEESGNKQAIMDSTIPPSHPKEAAIVRSLPGNNASYTAVVRGANEATGIAVVEVYALE